MGITSVFFFFGGWLCSPANGRWEVWEVATFFLSLALRALESLKLRKEFRLACFFLAGGLRKNETIYPKDYPCPFDFDDLLYPHKIMIV
jgi:hypothetical protein